MIIDQLPSLPSVQDTDEVAIERGTTTYKTTQAALVKSAIDAADDVANSLATYVRPNLLDNWYFVGGGSQLGRGTFPINQRGQTSYIGAGYGIDRWYGYQSQVTVNVTASGLSIHRSSGDFYSLAQKVSSVKSLRGKQVTATLLATGFNRLCLLADGVNIADSGATLAVNPINSVTATIPNDAEELLFTLYTTSTVDTLATAAKLELGSTQTLAHQVGGTWVLNEIPDYAEELSKCQAYFVRLAPGAWKYYGFVFAANETSATAVIALPQPMAKKPTITLSGDIRALNAITTTTASGYLSQNTVSFSIASTGMTYGAFYGLRNGGDGGHIDISAE